MKKIEMIYAYQLECGDLIHCWEGWHLVFNLKGTYARGRGLLVDIKLQDGWYRVECSARLKVLRHG